MTVMPSSLFPADSAALNQFVFTAASEGILLFESIQYGEGVITDLTVVDVNPAALRIVHRKRKELIGERLSAVFPGNFQNGLFERYRTALNTGKQDSFEVHYPFDGLDNWFQVSANPVSSTQLMITFTDISEIKRSADLLAQREAELRFILDAMPARVWYKDDQNGIIRLNQSAADAMGLTIEEAEGANTYDLFPTVAADYHKDDLIALDGDKPLLGIVERFVPKDGEQGWLTTDKIPFANPETQERRLLVVATDISRQKAAEDELLLANETLSQFASIVGHDIQAPLRQIGMLAGLLSEELGDDDNSANAHRITDTIQTTSVRLKRLVARLLELSRAGTSQIESEHVDLGSVIDAALTESGVRAADDASVSVELGDVDQVLGDFTMLRQVFANLFNNSLKHATKDSLELTVTAELVKGICTIKVRDNGEGIEPDRAESIFKVSSRMAESSPEKGTGIGLALCRTVLIRHGGSIRLDQDNQTGTCFVLTLMPDFHDEPEAASEPEPKPTSEQ